MDRKRAKSAGIIGAVVATTLALGACAPTVIHGEKGVDPLWSFPVTDNETPYSQCLRTLNDLTVKNKPVFAVGEVADKTGQINFDDSGYALTQGVSEMVTSALWKTGKVHMVERLDLRIPLAEMKLAEQGRLGRRTITDYSLPASDFILMGALTELNYNITSGGARLFVSGIGAGMRTVVINVALDLRVVNARNFAIAYNTSLQKQIYGYEVEAGIFRFFGDTLVEFDAGQVKNEPLQLGVRSVVEMAVYQLMTDFLGLPREEKCRLVEPDFMKNQLKEISDDQA